MIADILLAECSGQGWLVRGEQYIDDLLANTLPTHVTIEVVTCESKPAIDELRLRSAGEADTDPMMWLIHPAIMNRARGQLGQLTIVFAEWSASLNAAALAALQAAADAAAQHPAHVVALVRYLPEDAQAMVIAMADLRSGLLEARLTALGIPASRVVRETQDAAQPGQADRIDLVIRPG
jgi:hypothetical protein